MGAMLLVITGWICYPDYARSSETGHADGFQELTILLLLSTQPSAEEADKSITPRNLVSP